MMIFDTITLLSLLAIVYVAHATGRWKGRLETREELQQEQLKVIGQLRRAGLLPGPEDGEEE